jgi:hypothetical protein
MHTSHPQKHPRHLLFFQEARAGIKTRYDRHRFTNFFKTLDKRLNVKAEQLNPGFLFELMVTTKNWGGTQAGLVRVYAINKQEGSFFTTEQVKMAVVYQ